MTVLQACPVCGQGHLTPQVDTNTVVINGKSYDMPCHFAICNTCESEVADADDAQQNAEYMKSLLRDLNADLRDILMSKESNSDE